MDFNQIGQEVLFFAVVFLAAGGMVGFCLGFAVCWFFAR